MPGDAPPAARSARAAAAKKAPAKKAAAQKAAAQKKPPALGGGNGKPGRPSNADLRKKIQDSLDKLAGGLILAGMAAGKPEWVYDGKVIQYRAEAIALEVFKLAQSNAQVRKALESLYSGAQQLDSLSTLIGTVVPILVAHGKLPAGALAIPGAGSSDMLEAIGPPPERKQPPPLRLVPDPADQLPDDGDPAPAPPPPAPRPWRRPPRGAAPAPAPEPEPEPIHEPAPDLNQPAEDTTDVPLGALTSGFGTTLLPPLPDDT